MNSKTERKKKLIKQITYKDATIISVAALAVAICFSLTAALVGNLQVTFAQEITNLTIVEDIGENGGEGVAVVPITSTEALLGEINATIIAISGLMATAMSIVAGVITWIRAKTGDRIVSSDTNEWLQDIFEKIRKKDDDVRDIFRQVLEKSAEIDVVVDVVKRNSPELGERIDAAAPQINQKLQDIHGKVAHWQDEANKLYEVSPKDDPVGK